MSWIKTIAPNEADGHTKEIYEKILRQDRSLDNIIISQSIRPLSLESYLLLSDKLTNSRENKLPAWLIEAIGIYVSYLNSCEYCIEHHYNRLNKMMPIKSKVEKIRSALADDQPGEVLDVWEEAIMRYAKSLTQNPATITSEIIDELRLCGLEDEEILEVNQLVSFINYTNRIALGLGVAIENQTL